MPLYSALIPTGSSDVVGVFDQNFNQVFEEARPLKLSARPRSKLMEHPIEDGATIADHQVFLPDDIELSVLCTSADYRSTYQEIKQLYKASTILIVQTRADTFSNMLIEEMPHEEDAEQFDILVVGIKLHEAQFVTASYGTLPKSKVKAAANTSKVAAGEKLPTKVDNDSLLSKIFHK